MVDLEQFRSNATREGICEDYSVLWDKAGSKKQLMDIALTVQGIDYLCYAIANGWGISPEEISTRFEKYINGAYTYEDESGYTSTMYCEYYGSIEAEETILMLVNSDVTVSVPDWHVCDIFATGITNISIIGGGKVRLIAYGNKADVTVESVSENCRYKRIQKIDRDRE